VLFPESLGAVASFIFNLGTGNYRASTFKKKVDSLDWDEAKKQIQKWVYGGGMRLPGLVARRMEEAQYLGL
jgi:lysozyme